MDRLPEYPDDIFNIAFHPQSEILAQAAWDGAIWLWDVLTRQCIQRLDIYSPGFSVLAFSPDGSLLAGGGKDGRIALWEMHGQRKAQGFRLLPGHTALIRQIVFSPNGQFLATASEDGTVRLWDFDTDTLRHSLEGHTQHVNRVAIRPDSHILASGGNDGTIRLWDMATGNCLQTLRIPGPYEGMNITGVTGLSEAQKFALKALGAVETGDANLSFTVSNSLD